MLRAQTEEELLSGHLTGTYEAAIHGYLDNVIVFARLKAVPWPGG